MAEIPIIIGTVYAAMGVYNGLKTCVSVYQDAKRFKKYLADRRKKAETGGVCIEMEPFECFEDLDTFYMLGDSERTDGSDSSPSSSESSSSDTITKYGNGNPFITPPMLEKEDGKIVTLGFFTLL